LTVIAFAQLGELMEKLLVDKRFMQEPIGALQFGPFGRILVVLGADNYDSNAWRVTLNLTTNLKAIDSLCAIGREENEIKEYDIGCESSDELRDRNARVDALMRFVARFGDEFSDERGLSRRIFND
jgi:hypothetical protein